MNITHSVDERIVERARKVAEAGGKSLNQVIRDYLQQMGGEVDSRAQFEELRHLGREGQGRSGGRRISREELYERP